MKELEKQRNWDSQLLKERKFYCSRERELPEDCPNICCTWCSKNYVCEWSCSSVYEKKGKVKCSSQCTFEEAVFGRIFKRNEKVLVSESIEGEEI